MATSGAANGPRILLAAALLIAAAIVHAHVVLGAGEEGTRLVIRQTARISVLFFAAAFTASSLLRLRPAAWSRWMMRHRRWLGLSFALSHLVHLGAILRLLQIAPDFALDTPTIVGGGLAYVFVFLLAITSFDGAVKRLGARNWQRLHKTGAYYIWFIFTFSYLPRAVVSAPFIAPSLLLIGAWALRIAAHWRSRDAA